MRLAPDETEHDPRWTSILQRDPAADGTFVYAVTTTGIYCRPSCSARRARPENVRFHAGPAEAECAGYRACLRCKPNGLGPAAHRDALVEQACRWMEQFDGTPTLNALAERFDVSAYHFHRLFKATTGLTPKAYAMGLRAKRVRAELDRPGSSVTAAIFDAGYNTSSRFYEKSDAMLGMSPTSFKQGGERATIRFASGRCSLGEILVASSDKGICAVLLGDDPDLLLKDLQDRFPNAELVGGDTAFESTVARVVAFVEQPGLGLSLPLDLRGTAFQQRVWNALLAIPAGTTASYTDVARMIGAPKSVRAVAQACGANPVAIAIPCHRVVRNDGALSGYRWGIDRKRALLVREKEQTSTSM